MTDYTRYADNLAGTVLFQGLARDEVLSLLEEMQPPVCEGRHHPDADGIHRTFRVVAACSPLPDFRPREFPYSPHGFCEPGMLMGEIPALSRKDEFLNRTPLAIKPAFPAMEDCKIECLEFSPESFCAPISQKNSAAHAVVMRNMMGFLAQKVVGVRRKLYLEQSGWDMFAPSNRK